MARSQPKRIVYVGGGPGPNTKPPTIKGLPLYPLDQQISGKARVPSLTFALLKKQGKGPFQ